MKNTRLLALVSNKELANLKRRQPTSNSSLLSCLP